MAVEEVKHSVDLNTIAYDAPFSFEPPTKAWVNAQNWKGNRWTTVSIPDADLHDKWIIISGANNGIGREASLRFASWGANLILACRDPPPHETHPYVVVQECKTRAKEAGHVSECEWWDLDMTDLASVETFAARWLKTGRPLDILCNNAGIGSSPAGSAAFLTKDGFEIIHQVCLQSKCAIWASILKCCAGQLSVPRSPNTPPPPVDRESI